MGCCGDKRAALRHVLQGSPPRGQVPPYEKGFRALVRGPVTGRHYQYEEGAFSEELDSRDRSALLASNLFRKALG